MLSPLHLLDSPTRELAAVSLGQVRREHGLRLHVAVFVAASVLLASINLLTDRFSPPWCLWPITIWGALVLLHRHLVITRGRQLYAVRHRQEAARQDEADDREIAETPSASLRAKLLSSLTSAREALLEAAPEVATDLSLGETHALTALAWLDQAEALLSRGEGVPAARQEVVGSLSRHGLGTIRPSMESLLNEIDLREAALASLEKEVSRKRSILASFVLALEGAVAARDRGDVLAAVTGPIRDRVALLESAASSGPSAPQAAGAHHETSTVRIREEVSLARQLQRSILPEEAPKLPGLSVSHLYRPSSEVGGDFYDFYPLADDRLLIALGDASGHGLDSSMVSSMAKSALYTHVSSGRDLPGTMAEMNRMMWDTLGKQRLMTLTLLEIDVGRRRLEWVNAGQVFPLLRRGGTVHELEAPSYPLGVRRQISYEVRSEQLEAGDVLLVFTDGYVEALDSQGEPLGWERLEEHLRATRGSDTDVLVGALSDALRQHVGQGQPQDDVTLIAIGVEP